MTDYPEAARPLAELRPEHDFFVGIDSDGCAFDTMEIKHKECFTPNIIKHWNLQAVSKYAREAAEFVNLYSKWRGINRWPALVLVFDLLRERPEVQARSVEPPQAPRIREFIADDAFPKSNDGLKAYMEEHPDPELDRAWAWTTGVNETVADMVHGVPPFPYVRAEPAIPGRQGGHDRRLGHAAGGADPRVGGARHRPLRARSSPGKSRAKRRYTWSWPPGASTRRIAS